MAHILIAEDDQSMRDFLTMALEKAGHSVIAKGDGIAALESLQQTDKFDLLLTDIVMPGMDGVELSRRATALNPTLKIMFITGFAAVAIENSDLKKNNAKLLSKPFHLKELAAQIESLLAPGQ